MSRFAIQQARFNGALYPGINGFLGKPGKEIDSDETDGVPDETAHHDMLAAGMIDLSTRNLGFLSVLDGSTSAWLKAFDGTNGLEVIGGKANPSSTGYQGGSVHVSRKALRGVLIGTSINWSRKGKAELNLTGMAISPDGTTQALVPSLTTLPTLPTPDFGYKLTSLTLSGDATPAVDSLSITCDPRAEFDYAYGLPEPTAVNMAGVNGAVQWRLQATIGDCDLGSGSGAVVAVFTRLANGGGFGSNTVTVTFNSNYTIEEGLGGQAGSSMTRQLICRPRYNGTTKPVTWALV